VIKLKLPESIRIHLVVNTNRVVKYRDLFKRQKVKELKLVWFILKAKVHGI